MVQGTTDGWEQLFVFTRFFFAVLERYTKKTKAGMEIFGFSFYPMGFLEFWGGFGAEASWNSSSFHVVMDVH